MKRATLLVTSAAGLALATAGAVVIADYLLAREYRSPIHVRGPEQTPRMQALRDLAEEAERRALEPSSDGAGEPAVALSPEAERGETVFTANGCQACHTITGEKRIGPSLLGVFGAEQALADGTVVVADRDYIRESILEPQQKVVAGYESQMPSYADLLTEEDLAHLVEYVASLGAGSGGG